MAIEFVAQRLEIGDVVLVSLPEQVEKVEATVIRDVDRTETTVRVMLRADGREDFAKEWSLAELVTAFVDLDFALAVLVPRQALREHTG
jgi:hypothetical protein